MGRDPTPLLGNASGPLLVIGSGACLADDLRQADHKNWPGDKMVANITGLLYPLPFRHWATVHGDIPIFHPNNMNINHLGAGYRRVRGRMEFKSCLVHCARMGRADASLSHEWMYEWGESYFPRHMRNGSTGLFMVEIGLKMGYAPIVLAGVPLDNSGYCWNVGDYDSVWTGTAPPPQVHEAWRKRSPAWGGKVTSLSGWTRQHLGEPEWLRSTTTATEPMTSARSRSPRPAAPSPAMSASPSPTR